VAHELAWVAQNVQGYSPRDKYTLRQIRALYGRDAKAPARHQGTRVSSHADILAAYFKTIGHPPEAIPALVAAELGRPPGPA
jgi:hypothetical protein